MTPRAPRLCSPRLCSPRLRLALASAAALLASCEPTTTQPHALPALREGFTWLGQESAVVLSGSMSGFNVDATGFAAQGDRIVVVEMTGQWFASFSTHPEFNWDTGTYDDVSGGTTTSSSWFTLHRSEDGGRTWQEELPLRPARGAPTGWTSGVVLAGERAFTTVSSESGRSVVEIDLETGIYTGVELSYDDGGRWQPAVAHARAFGSTVVSSEVVADGGFFYGWRGDLRTGEASMHHVEHPECIPWRNIMGARRGRGTIPTSSDTIQGLCTMPDDRTCWFTWRLDPAAPASTPMEIRGCASPSQIDAVLERRGIVPRFTPAHLVPTPVGLHVVGSAEYRMPEGESRLHVVALFLRADGAAPDLVDLGPGGLVEGDHLSLRAQWEGFVRVGCEAEQLGVEGEGCADGIAGARLAGWDPRASRFGFVELSPSACLDPAACPGAPSRLFAVGDGRYLATWHVSATDGRNVTVGYAIGFVTPPWYEPPPDPTDHPASELELRCWAEQRCFPIGPPDVWTAPELVRSCVDRWRSVRGAPDAHWLAFAAADPLDCDALRATDPGGFVLPSACTPGECDPEGGMPCGGWAPHCSQVNGGTCSVVDGLAGCFADACAAGSTSEPARCDAAGRWVSCAGGIVDDCAARGLACDDESGCGHADPACGEGSAGMQRCDGDELATCLAPGLSSRVDCARDGASCEEDDRSVLCARPYVPPEPPRCEGDRLILDGRVIDCAAVGMRCHASATAGFGVCST